MSREEDAYVIERMGKLLAEIAIVVNGPEPPLTSWSYHDLPEKVRALKQAPPAASNSRMADALRWIVRYADTPERAARGPHRGMAAIKHVAERALEQAPPAAVVPDGYVPVPVEPTQEMLDAAGMCIVPDGKKWLDQSNRETWAAMLAANKVQP